jgi:transposase
MMNLYLAEFAKTIAEGVHVVMVLDGAGWHGKAALDVPAAITLVPLPPYSPELNPVERLWLYLKETSLSLRIFADQAAIIDACCQA